LITQDDVNKALKEYDIKQRELIKIVTRKSQKEGVKKREKSKSNKVTKKVTVLFKYLIVLRSRFGIEVSDSKG
jgi:hypothetical protein